MSVGPEGDQLGWALWFRAAERIDVPADGPVPGPLDVDPLPEQSVRSGAELAEDWLWWWRTLLALPAPVTPPARAELTRFSPPDFEGLADCPMLRQVVIARWREAHAWHSARKRARIDALHATLGREGTVVRAVEAEIGHKAAPFSVRIIVLPVIDEQIRSAGQATFLVPERVYASSGYDDWLRKVVRALA